MSIEFIVSDLISAPAGVLYSAWLDSEIHSRMTGGKAEVSDQVGGEFQAWDGYIQGRNLTLEPNSRIVQSWRTQDFHPDDPDSILEITFISQGTETLINIKHQTLPEDGIRYQQGWVEAYFEPMKRYFSAGNS